MPRPKSVNDIRRMHGLLSYYRKMVPKFAILAEPFTKLLRKHAIFVWGEEQEKGFQAIKVILTSDPIICHFRYTDDVVVKTDASVVGLAGILTQRRDGLWKIVACFSRKTNDAEKNYSPTELEALAIVATLEHFRHYLLGKQFLILTDHCALCSFDRKLSKNARLQRWKWSLQEYDFKIKYVKGNEQCDVDCLSRALIDSAQDYYLEDKVLVTLPYKQSVNIVTPLDVNNWKLLSEADEQAKDHYIKARARAKGYKLTHGLLYYEDKLFVPQSLR